ncbi:MAG: ATP-binding protein [Lachnospiraceae bacterium]|nr:ATP-binding protein [Lachnospiraceae bacterium]
MEKELTIEAVMDNLDQVLAFVDEQLEACECPIRYQLPIDVAVEELYTNIASYAYSPEIGTATVRVEVKDDPLSVIITFVDEGVPYDPLKKADPDLNVEIEDRQVGGFGIFMVKNSMDEVTYEYKDGQNILRIRKDLLDEEPEDTEDM